MEYNISHLLGELLLLTTVTLRNVPKIAEKADLQAQHVASLYIVYFYYCFCVTKEALSYKKRKNIEEKKKLNRNKISATVTIWTTYYRHMTIWLRQQWLRTCRLGVLSFPV